MTTHDRAAVSRWQIPDQSPRRRERSRWRRPPELLLIAGIALILVGLLATFGPLTIDLGGTDSSPADASTGDPVGDGGTNGDRASGSDESESIREPIGGMDSREGSPERMTGGGTRETCFIE